MRKLDTAQLGTTKFATAQLGTAKYATGRGTGPVPVAQRLIRDLPRAGRAAAVRTRYQAPRRTY
ncbi:hypothetical protein ACFQ2B_16725 [Streptomyces stramineus]|uniref:Uncharacterized protein n=1 Tax=Streptomyces stramineus TaxID=173861 RepID=A0ABP3KVL4_9ACTN